MVKSFALSILAILLLQGCFVHKIKVDPTISRGSPKGEPDYEEWNNIFLFGLAPNASTNASKLCDGAGGGVGFVETRRTFFNQFVGFFFLEVYSPSTTRIYCSNSQK